MTPEPAIAKTSHTHSLTKSARLTLGELRAWIYGLDTLPSETSVQITTYDSQRDGYKVTITVQEGAV